MIKNNCDSCGCPLPDNFKPGYLILEFSIDNLAKLLEGEFDEVKCKTCDNPLGIRPSIVVVFTEPSEVLVVFGSQIDIEQEEYRLNFLAELKDNSGSNPTEIADLDDLRKSIIKRTKSRILQINPFLIAAAKNNLDEYIGQHWRALTPNVFAALYLCQITTIPGVELGIGTTTPELFSSEAATKHLLELITKIQIQSWIALCFDRNNQSNTLEEDLRRFIDPGIIFPNSTEKFFEVIDLLETNSELELDPGTRFCLEAVRASLCSVLQKENTHASDWAELFFSLELAYELACLREDDLLAPQLKGLIISEKRAQKTVSFRGAWDAVARRVQKYSTSILNETNNFEPELLSLDKIATKAGYSNLLNRFTDEGIYFQAPTKVEIDKYKEFLQYILDSFKKTIPSNELIHYLLGEARKIARLLVQQNRIEDLEDLSDEIITMIGDNQPYETQAFVEAWLGSFLKQLGSAKRFIKRIGKEPRDWEQNLSIEARVYLWTERSNALRLLGEFEEALKIAQDIVQLISDTDVIGRRDKHVAQRNVAILLRETGSPDSALDILYQLKTDIQDNEEQKIDVLESLITTLGDLGKIDNAIQHCDEALKLAVGPKAYKKYKMLANKATLLNLEKRYQEASEILLQIKTDNTSLESNSILPEASAWITILSNEPTIASKEQEKIQEVFKNLVEFSNITEQQGNILAYLNTLRLVAIFNKVINSSQVVEYYQKVYSEYQKYGQVQSSETLVLLASFAYEKQQIETARQYLAELPEAISAKFGGILDIAQAVEGTHELEWAFNQLTYVVLNLFEQKLGVTWEDIRLVAELRRDAIGRSKVLRQKNLQFFDHSIFERVVSNKALKQFAQKMGNAAVIEWIHDSQNIGCFLTQIKDKGEISSRWLTNPEIDLPKLAEKIRNKLKNWYIGRPGDPFDVQEWQILKKWLLQQLSLYLSDEDHVVFIEHEDYVGLPWHVAIAYNWTSSYASSWTSLVEISNQSKSKNFSKLGVLQVPRFKESQEIIDAFEESVSRTKNLAIKHNYQTIIPNTYSGDRNSFHEMMEQADIVKILCHGFVDTDGEIALMIAHNGSLPLADSVSSGSPTGRLHRLSWRDCQQLSKTPFIVFSAACSSGTTKIAGLGERMGFFNALRNNTQTLIAPQWDVYASEVIPILDALFEQYLDNQQGLATTLREVCIMAEKNANIPHWLAWSLAIEGDWR